MGVFTVQTPNGQKLDIEAPDEATAISGAQKWHADNINTPADVARSGASGLMRGVAAIPGQVGDVAELGAMGIDKAVQGVGSLIGRDLPRHSDAGTSWKLPDTNSISNAMEKYVTNPLGITSPNYEPQTTSGKYTKTTAGFLPMAGLAGVTGGESLIPSLLKYGAAPGMASEAAGQRTEGTAWEPWARAGTGLVGGIGAALAGKGVSAAQNYNTGLSSGDKIAKVLQQGTTEPIPYISPGAVRRVAGASEADALNPTNVQSRVNAGQGDSMLLDMGRQLAARSESVSQQPGKGQNVLLDNLLTRVHGVDPATSLPREEGAAASGARYTNTLDQQMGPSPNVVQLQKSIEDHSASIVGPSYKKIYDDNPAVWSPKISELTQRPAIADAIKSVPSVAKNYGEDIKPFDAASAAKSGGPSLKYWDWVKRNMDSEVNSMLGSGGFKTLDSGEKIDVRGVITARNDLKTELDNLTGGQYAKARAIAAEKPHLEQGLEFGQNVLKRNVLPEIEHQQFNEMSIPAQAMAKAGARKYLDNVMGSSGNEARSAKAALNNDFAMQKISDMFGPQTASALKSRLDTEVGFQQKSNQAAAGAATARRLLGAEDTKNPSLGQTPQITAAGIIPTAVKGGLDFLGTNVMGNTREGMAHILTAKDQKISPVVRELLNYTAKRNQNASSYDIKALAASLMAGSSARQ